MDMSREINTTVSMIDNFSRFRSRGLINSGPLEGLEAFFHAQRFANFHAAAGGALLSVSGRIRPANVGSHVECFQIERCSLNWFKNMEKTSFNDGGLFKQHNCATRPVEFRTEQQKLDDRQSREELLRVEEAKCREILKQKEKAIKRRKL
uniref:TPX2 domain-containing protein n=1 Tax=Caenorhabditis tropicalis TaxID=1561998 RepID=A0A1I7V448_9PELO